MKKLVLPFLSIVFSIGIYSCSNTESNDSEKVEVELSDDASEAAAKEEFKAEIKEIEKVIKQTSGKNAKSHTERLANRLIAFADEFPKDSLAPEMIFKAGNVYIGLGEYNKAISFFDRAAKHYPEYIKRPELVYMSGFVYDYHLSQKGKAKEYYERVIAEYPNHIFAKDAKQAIENLSMSDEDLIRKFEAQNKKAS